MSGRIELKVREGTSKDVRYRYYPEAYWEVTGENGLKVNISPSYKILRNALVDFRKHELKVDKTRRRTTYVSKLIKMLEDLLREVRQTELNEYEIENIEDVYYAPMKDI